MKKFCGSNLGQNGPKSGPKLSFCHFLKFGAVGIMGQMGQNQSQNEAFCHFFKFDSLVILKVA